MNQIQACTYLPKKKHLAALYSDRRVKKLEYLKRYTDEIITGNEQLLMNGTEEILQYRTDVIDIVQAIRDSRPVSPSEHVGKLVHLAGVTYDTDALPHHLSTRQVTSFFQLKCVHPVSIYNCGP